MKGRLGTIPNKVSALGYFDLLCVVLTGDAVNEAMFASDAGRQMLARWASSPFIELEKWHDKSALS
jgi:hypothetical protein